MENIYKHIEKLLAKHDYVVVPNLGGFVVQKESAKILADRIVAPQAVVSFNPLMQHLDGLLAIEIAKSENIPYRKAVDTIDTFVAGINSNLELYIKVQIGELGFLETTVEKQFIFTPNSRPEFLPQNIGLSDVFIHQNDKKAAQAKTITFTIPSKNTFRYAATAILILCLMFIAPSVVDVRKADKADLSVLIDLEPVPIKNSIPVVSNHAISTTDTLTIQLEKKFHVIVATLSTPEMATEICTRLQHDSFPTTQILPHAKIYRVAVQSFSDFESAINYMQQLKKHDSRFEEAWVYCEE